jgi:hypothetical protein
MHDGSVVAYGDNSHGQCDILSQRTEWLECLAGGLSWIPYAAHSVLCRSSITRVLQASYDGHIAHFCWMSGEAACELNVGVSDHLSDVSTQLGEALKLSCDTFDVVFPGGELLSMALVKKPLGMFSSAFMSSGEGATKHD